LKKSVIFRQHCKKSQCETLPESLRKNHNVWEKIRPYNSFKKLDKIDKKITPRWKKSSKAGLGILKADFLFYGGYFSLHLWEMRGKGLTIINSQV
jgi:hypothetical protein